jgi:hypothetical protein
MDFLKKNIDFIKQEWDLSNNEIDSRHKFWYEV